MPITILANENVNVRQMMQIRFSHWLNHGMRDAINVFWEIANLNTKLWTKSYACVPLLL